MTTSSRLLSHTKKQAKILRVLMIEDDTHYCEFVRQLLERRTNPKFVLNKVATLEAALAFLQKEVPDVILLDLNLPDSHGLTSLDRVKEQCEGCPVVILTGSDDDTLGLKAVASGAHDYLVKQNVGKDSLVRCIRYAIERRRSEEQTLRLTVIEDFVGTLAHDMRVPLIGANKLLDALLAGGVGNLLEPQKQLIQTLKESNDNQLRLVDSLLEIYRYDSGTSHLSLSVLDLPALTEETITACRVNYNGPIVFQNHLDKQNTLIQGDKEALVHLLTHLIENAKTFSDKDKPITITATLQRTMVAIEVHNFGQVIPQNVQKELFQKFWHGVPGKSYVAHTGLGLYLCHNIVKLHHGSIACRSAEDTGTSIFVKLPI